MPKAKGTKGGNPNPVQTQEFVAKQFRAVGLPEDVELSKVALCVKLPVEVDAVVRALPERSDWLRRVITEAAERELLEPKLEPPPTTTTRRRRLASRPAAEAEPEPESGFRSGDCVKLPSGDRAFVERVLPDGRYQIRWEAIGGGLDEIPGHLLTLVNRGS